MDMQISSKIIDSLADQSPPEILSQLLTLSRLTSRGFEGLPCAGIELVLRSGYCLSGILKKRTGEYLAILRSDQHELPTLCWISANDISVISFIEHSKWIHFLTDLPVETDRTIGNLEFKQLCEPLFQEAHLKTGLQINLIETPSPAREGHGRSLKWHLQSVKVAIEELRKQHGSAALAELKEVQIYFSEAAHDFKANMKTNMLLLHLPYSLRAIESSVSQISSAIASAF